jgi:hypothetical protein
LEDPYTNNGKDKTRKKKGGKRWKKVERKSKQGKEKVRRDFMWAKVFVPSTF